MIDADKLAGLVAAATNLRPTRYDGYFVDASGNVWSDHNWRGYGLRKLAPKPNSHGYLTVKAKIAGGVKKMFVHKEVCWAFHGQRPSQFHQVRHLNGVRDCNSSDNLAWGTISENAIDRHRHGTCKAAENGKASAAKALATRQRNKGGRDGRM